MKTVQKKTMDELIRLVRKYHATGDVDILPAKNDTADQLAGQAFNGDTLHWLEFTDIASAAVRLDKNTTNQQIYRMFEIVGIEVPE